MAQIAREVWRDRELGDRLDREAKELRRAFNEAYWVDKRGGYYALALDGDKRPVDSMCSNMGHLLWSGIVPSERADAVVDRLMGEELWSGWGVRTMSSATRRKPARVPQRHRLAPRQLPHRARARALQTVAGGAEDRATPAGSGRASRPPAARIFAGMPRAETPFPIAYPTAARPQAWAAATRSSSCACCSAWSRPAAGTRWRRRRPSSCRRGWARCGCPACRASTAAGRCAWTMGTSPWSPNEDRRDQPGVVPGAADGLRRYRVDRVAARRRARGRRPRRHALRLGRLAYEGEARFGVRHSAERAHRDVDCRAPPLPRLLRARRRLRGDQRPLRPAGGGARRSHQDADAAHRPRPHGRDRRRRVRADRARLAAGWADLDLHEPAHAEPGPAVESPTLPERARPLALSHEAAPRRLRPSSSGA